MSIVELLSERYAYDHLKNEVQPDNTLNEKHLMAMIKQTKPDEQIELIEMLLLNKNFNPLFNGRCLFDYAYVSGNTKMIELLFNDDRIDPNKGNIPYTIGICFAAINGYTEFVEVLLKNPKVDPTVYNNYAYVQSCDMGFADIVKLLSEDGRIDLTAANIKAAQNKAAAKKEFGEISKLWK